jgi:hypothetical protein
MILLREAWHFYNVFRMFIWRLRTEEIWNNCFLFSVQPVATNFITVFQLSSHESKDGSILFGRRLK